MNGFVSFKDEGFDGDAAIGPVFVIDEDAMNADPNLDHERHTMPFGYEPAWREDHGWQRRSYAERLANERGLELRE